MEADVEDLQLVPAMVRDKREFWKRVSHGAASAG